MALIALMAMPFGLETIPLKVMARGIEMLTGVAEWIAALDGAVIHLSAMPTYALTLLALGGLWLCLWRRRWRSAGLVIAAFGVAAASDRPRPDILIEREGKTLAVRTAEGLLAVPAFARTNYSIEKWLLADGDDEAETVTSRNKAYACDAQACLAEIENKSVAFLRDPSAIWEECRRSDIVVAPFPIYRKCPKARVVIDLKSLKAEGAHALFLGGQSIGIDTVARRRGHRPWVRTQPQIRHKKTLAEPERRSKPKGSNRQ